MKICTKISATFAAVSDTKRVAECQDHNCGMKSDGESQHGYLSECMTQCLHLLLQFTMVMQVCIV